MALRAVMPGSDWWRPMAVARGNELGRVERAIDRSYGEAPARAPRPDPVHERASQPSPGDTCPRRSPDAPRQDGRDSSQHMCTNLPAAGKTNSRRPAGGSRIGHRQTINLRLTAPSLDFTCFRSDDGGVFRPYSSGAVRGEFSNFYNGLTYAKHDRNRGLSSF